MVSCTSVWVVEVGKDVKLVWPYGGLGWDCDEKEGTAFHCGLHPDWPGGHWLGCGTGVALGGGVAWGTQGLLGVGQGQAHVHGVVVNSVAVGLGWDCSGLVVWGEDCVEAGMSGWGSGGSEFLGLVWVGWA